MKGTPVILVDAMLSPLLVGCLKALGYGESYHIKDILSIDASDEEIKSFIEYHSAIFVTKDRRHFNGVKNGYVILLRDGKFEDELRELLKSLTEMGYPPKLDWIRIEAYTSSP
ncbi:MAG: DUF5615 family PIN-like protein [Candidatus Bathyarchaeia archaeon]|nr:DUF5615 family PIN-like protein [Candidatus Bathyarchaeota archaeon]